MALLQVEKRCSRCFATGETISYSAKNKRFYCLEHFPSEPHSYSQLCQACNNNPVGSYSISKEGRRLKTCFTCYAKANLVQCISCKNFSTISQVRTVETNSGKKKVCTKCLVNKKEFFNGICVSCKESAFLMYRSQKGPGTKADLCRPCYDGNEAKRAPCTGCKTKLKIRHHSSEGKPYCGNCHDTKPLN